MLDTWFKCWLLTSNLATKLKCFIKQIVIFVIKWLSSCPLCVWEVLEWLFLYIKSQMFIMSQCIVIFIQKPLHPHNHSIHFQCPSRLLFVNDLISIVSYYKYGFFYTMQVFLIWGWSFLQKFTLSSLQRLFVDKQIILLAWFGVKLHFITLMENFICLFHLFVFHIIFFCLLILVIIYHFCFVNYSWCTSTK